MTLARELAWQNYDLRSKSSIAYQYGRYALGMQYEDLPAEIVHQGKRCLLDTIACAIAGSTAPGSVICENVARQLGGTPEATIVGSGFRTTAMNATLANCYMVRCLEYNDMGGGAHNTDAVPSILAVAEREHSHGRDMLTALVISYELGGRVRESIPGGTHFGHVMMHGRLAHGLFSPDTRAGLTMPATLGKLMGLTESQIANAIGICASGNVVLDVIDTHGEEATMRKNLRFGFIAYEAIHACLLAQAGFTGPVRVVEGEFGWQDLLFGGELDLERLVDFSGWLIQDVTHKYVCTNRTLQGEVMATIALVKEHDLKPEDIESVDVYTATSASAWHTPDDRYPRNADGAGDSPYFANAVAVKLRSCGPEVMKDANFSDPVVLDLIDRVRPHADSSMGRWDGKSVITTKDGRTLEKRVTNSRHSDTDLEQKLRGAAAPYMSNVRIDQLLDHIWNVDKLDDISPLMQALVFKD